MSQAKTLSIFKDAHIHEYSLYVTEVHPKTSIVISVRCQFCVYFAEKIGKRKKTDAIMTVKWCLFGVKTTLFLRELQTALYSTRSRLTSPILIANAGT